MHSTDEENRLGSIPAAVAAAAGGVPEIQSHYEYIGLL